MRRLAAEAVLAWRLIRGAPAQAWLLVLCVAIGVAARVFVGSLTSAAESALAREARPLLGGDLEIAGNRPLDAARRAQLVALLPAGARSAEVSSFVSMARVGDATRLVEVRAVGSGWPLVGAVTLDAGPLHVTSLASAFAGRDGLPGVAVQGDLLPLLGARLGDHLRLGNADFVITATVSDEPGVGANPFTLGPRVLMPAAALAATGLSGFGSRVRHQLVVALPDAGAGEALATTLASAWGLERGESGFGARGPDTGDIQVRTAREAQFGLARMFDRLGDFLRLLALAALLLGGVGVASLVRAFVAERLDVAATLAVLGATPGRVARIVLMQTLALAAMGAALGAVLGALAQWAAISALRGRLPLGLEPALDRGALGWGMGVGLLVAGAFAAGPLIAVRRLPPLAVLRGETPDLRGGAPALAMMGFGAVAVAVIASYEARSWWVGGGFVLALAVGALVLRLSGGVALQMLARLRPRAVGLRHGLANLGRPGLRAGAAVVAIGLAALLIATLAIYRESLERELDPALRGDLPALFVVDLQDDQRDAFAALVRDETGTDALGLSPMLMARYRGRVSATSESAAGPSREDQQRRFFRDREQRLTWRDKPGPDETITAGRWPADDPTDPTRAEVSLEQTFAERLGVDVGDRLRFQIQGVTLEATVVGLREVRFASLRPNFFIVANPGALAEAAPTWIAAIADLPAEDRTRLQGRIVSEFPNATVIDIAAVGRTVRSVVGKIIDALRLVAGFALLAGVAVLAGVCLAGARERRLDAALLRVLGARDRTIAAALLAEFGAIGAIAATLGTALALGVAWFLVLRLGLSLVVPWLWLGGLVAGITLLSACAALVVSRQVFSAPPLTVLREG